MISTLLATVLMISVEVPPSIAKQCAKEVNIPYQSDNFTDEEWEQFQACLIREIHKTKYIQTNHV